MVSKCQLNILLLEGKCAIKRQMYSNLVRKQLLSALMVRSPCSAYYFNVDTAVLNTDPDSCPLEVKPRPMKTIYINCHGEYTGKIISNIL